ncbi:MAG: pyruvate kinase [Piscirickettsiaceae bacterium CG_4_9_14_3_um_filter_43_564]|nr:pyruvate kinase [Thiomicrospira sp.]OIP93722.1 MAG: pyruvate kinase [Thiomicrospira sp. CG2_30_44_34]PIQ02701.1 MAG: pyruvate kinase [Piscirickettsiaceae bacterium CG18_big_fil_WC_8_21_14_2_50_44_103]PIU38851.1 MAG: pyruvate kinase [Piscirickettsiaceae bacterium CG07_land_8_20_14_0_80_44_28]PIW58028.1 MAG: pyruvate kinase [Piscirickettsiaceae bacterium CG12_big_fil_rev_8_21_14_0_65_44_934]PIW78014.1 MAG: pyruvate kinase [Piscirickettsiaceae bacterium CG_4_8_14_3_um_filter_44_38]PIX79188.1 
MPSGLRRTKIVATLGPATDRDGELEKMIEAGVDVVRINMSHGNPQEHVGRASKVREIAAKLDREVGVLVDLQGPKIRIARFTDDSIFLVAGDTFALDNNVDPLAGNQKEVGLTYKSLPYDVKPGNRLLLDDGRVVLDVDKVEGERVICTVVVGGKLSNNKGINLQGGGLSAAALTEKDKEDILTAAEIQCDYLALSFPRSAEDVEYCRSLAEKAGLNCSIVSKIERAEAVNDDFTLDSIILASDVIMIARGDLGVEVGDAQLPALQKKMIKRARQLNRITITATQMMETMIENAIPTRAEVFDVANAVMDGTDAVMLSGETATGHSPSLVIQTMAEIAREAEKSRSTRESTHRIDESFTAVDETIAMAAMYAANHFGVTCIAALTESGNTPLLMSRISSGIPIIALTPHIDTRRKVTLYRGVYPTTVDYTGLSDEEVQDKILLELKAKGVTKAGDLVVVTRGQSRGLMGGTNQMEIVKVP